MKTRFTFFILLILLINPLVGMPQASQAQPVGEVNQKGPVDAVLQPMPLQAQPATGDGIFLRGITLLPGQSEPAAQAADGLPAADPDNPSRLQEAGDALWLVQFNSPILPQWREALLSAGLEIVTYVPENAYLVWGSQPGAMVGEVSRLTGAVQYSGAYLPDYRLSPNLRQSPAGDGAGSTPEPDELLQVTVQFFQTDRLADSIRALETLSTQVIQPAEPLLNTTIMRVEITSKAVATVATWPDVLNIEPYAAPEMMDEIQGQILAGNLMQNYGFVLPYAPGYLNWLASKGFPNQPDAYPLVDVVDDGVDSGNITDVLHPDFFLLGNKANTSRVLYMANCTRDAAGDGAGGHGNLNAGIITGYNNKQGAPYQDAQGYHIGLGISPFGRVGSTKVFNNAGRYETPRCNNSFSFIVNASYAAGARISSNSWGRQAGAAYTTDAQMYDALTRDASFDAGSQEMLHIFAAGNSGPDEQTVGSPGTAKNVITVGAEENVRDNGVTDGCNVFDSNSADDVADFSSRGPTLDGRAKPDIVAPGTHVQAQASQARGYSGQGVCGGYNNLQKDPYYPQQQTLYTWSSGTSHSTPAIAGVAQLAANYYQRNLNPGKTASPAMIKALMLNTPRYLQGIAAGDNLPSPNQGWGSADMSRMFDETSRIFIDQEVLFSETGQVYDVSNQIFNPTRPLNVTLVWTDAPGSPIAARALVNDLDLEITIGGQTYYGNTFSGSQSISGGSPDRLNNVENVFLPAGISGAFDVRVTAHRIAGDGVPGNGTPIDQDFALIIYNGGTGAISNNYISYIPVVIEESTQADQTFSNLRDP